MTARDSLLCDGAAPIVVEKYGLALSRRNHAMSVEKWRVVENAINILSGDKCL